MTSPLASSKIYLPQMHSTISPELHSFSQAERLVDDWCAQYVNKKNIEQVQGCRYGLLGRLYFPRSEKRLVPASKFLAWTYISDEKPQSMSIQGYGKIWETIMKDPDFKHEELTNDKDLQHQINMFSCLWKEVSLGLTPTQANNLCNSIQDVYDSFAVRRDWYLNKFVPKVDEYMILRRRTFGGATFLQISEYALDANVQGTLSNSSLLTKAQGSAIDHMMLTNDVFSFKKEWLCGEYMNIIPLIAWQHKCSLQDAVLEACRIIKVAEEEYLAAKKNMVSSLVLAQTPCYIQYVNGLGNMIMGNREWCWQTARYHGLGWSPPKERCSVMNLLDPFLHERPAKHFGADIL